MAVLVSTVAMLALIELALHVLDWPRPVTNFTPVQGLFYDSPIQGLRFQLNPGARSFYEVPDGGPRMEYVINSTGARDREYAKAKPKGIYRIIFLGDSFTFGTGVALKDTFVKQVEKRLGSGYEAINFGVPGYDTREEVLLLEHKCPRFSPDLVVIVLFLNDGHGGYSDEVFNVEVHDPLAEYSRLYRAVRLAARRKEAEEALIRDWTESFADGSSSWKGIRGALKKAAGLSKRDGFKLAVVVFPVLYWLDETYPFREVHEKVVRYVESLGVPALDLYPAFMGEDGPSLWVHQSNQHPNARGHAIAGQAIYEFLEQRNLVGEGP
jgi:lysophospholipase L1-like esterase